MSTLQELVLLPREEQESRGVLYTPGEIAQQPDTWGGTLSIFEREQSRICTFLEGAGVIGPQEHKPAVFLIGAGTSDYIGHALVLLLRQRWQCEVTACASTDLLPDLEAYIVPGRRYLFISFSRSGDSPEGVAIIEQTISVYPQIAHLVVTCNPKARMIALASEHPHACVVVLDDSVNDRSLAMTSSFTNMVILGQCLAHAWSLSSYLPVLEQLQAAGRSLLGTGFTAAEELAARKLPRVCLVGIGPLAAVARESALKILEMSAGQVKTMSETTLGLRHGPMAALDLQTLFICFVPSDTRRQGYAADLLAELGAKQVTAARIAVGPASARVSFNYLCEEYISLDADVADEYRPPIDVIFGQLLGLCTSIEHGLQPDTPSPGGVINRVVQDFVIYR